MEYLGSIIKIPQLQDKREDVPEPRASFLSRITLCFSALQTPPPGSLL